MKRVWMIRISAFFAGAVTDSAVSHLRGNSVVTVPEIIIAVCLIILAATWANQLSKSFKPAD